MSKVALVFALLVVPLIALPLYWIGDKVARELVVSLRVRDVILLSALVLPPLLSVFIARWGGPTSWLMAIALGIVSGLIAVVLTTFVPFIVFCSGDSDCLT
jgi:hypothetical protein